VIPTREKLLAARFFDLLFLQLTFGWKMRLSAAFYGTEREFQRLTETYRLSAVGNHCNFVGLNINYLR